MHNRLAWALAAAAILGAAQPAPAPPVIEAGGVRNAASLLPMGAPGGGIAPGSIFSIRGSGFVPGAVVQIRRGAAEWNAVPLQIRSGEIRAQAPAGVPPGPASIVVRQGSRESSPSPVRIAPSSFGVFTRNGDGTGYIVDEAVRRGQRVTLPGTGLGAGKPEVFVGGVSARVIRYGPAQAGSGADEIEIAIPDNAPRGCHVPVQVRMDGAAPGNTATLAIEPDSPRCDERERIGRYLRRGGSAGFVIPFRLSMDYAPEGLDGIEFVTDALAAGFGEADGSDELSRALYLPPAGACTVYGAHATLDTLPPLLRRMLAPHLTTLEAGDLRAGSAAEGRTVPPGKEREIYYYGVLGRTPPDASGTTLPLFLKPGDLTIAAAGGSGVPPFSVRVRIPEPIVWTNRKRARRLSRTRDFTVRWKLRAPSQHVAVGGLSLNSEDNAVVGFLCNVDGAAGAFRIPAVILQSLPASLPPPGRPGGFLFLATVPSAGESVFFIDGVHGLLGIGAAVDGRTVQYQ